MVILALGTTAPDWSVTVPAIVPVGAWASSAPTAVKTSRHVRQSRNMDPPKCKINDMQRGADIVPNLTAIQEMPCDAEVAGDQEGSQKSGLKVRGRV